jgi:hypothetical protein
MSERPPSQLLAELLLNQPLDDYIADKRASRPQWSWRLIAEQIGIDTAGKVNVTGETVRQWYSHVDQASAGAA